jgi:hypothetical protein
MTEDSADTQLPFPPTPAASADKQQLFNNFQPPFHHYSTYRIKQTDGKQKVPAFFTLRLTDMKDPHRVIHKPAGNSYFSFFGVFMNKDLYLRNRGGFHVVVELQLFNKFHEFYFKTRREKKGSFVEKIGCGRSRNNCNF